MESCSWLEILWAISEASLNVGAFFPIPPNDAANLFEQAFASWTRHLSPITTRLKGLWLVSWSIPFTFRLREEWIAPQSPLSEEQTRSKTIGVSAGCCCCCSFKNGPAKISQVGCRTLRSSNKGTARVHRLLSSYEFGAGNHLHCGGYLFDVFNRFQA